MSEEFQEARKRVCAALVDERLTVGASVTWSGRGAVAENLAGSDPALSPAYVDDLGRVWKERRSGWEGSQSALVCVLDLRSLAAAIDAPPTEVQHLGLVG